MGYIGSTTRCYSCTVLMLALLLLLSAAADDDDIATSTATSTETKGAPLTFSTNGYAEKMLSMTSSTVKSDETETSMTSIVDGNRNAAIPLSPANYENTKKTGPVLSRGLFPATFAFSNAGNTFTDRKAIGFVTLRDVISVHNATFLEEIPKSSTSLRHNMPEGEIQTKTSTDTRVRDRLPQSSTTGTHDMPEGLPTSRYTLSQSHATLRSEIPVSQENIRSKTPEPNSTASDETQKTASDKTPEVDHQTPRVEPSSGDPYTLTVSQNYTGRQTQTVWLDSGEQYTVTVRQNDTLAVTLTHCSVRQYMYLVNMTLPEDVNFTFHGRTDREWNAPGDVSCRPSPKARPIGFLYEQDESDVACRTEAYSWFENGRIMHSYCIVSTDVVIGVGKTRIIIGKPTEPRIRKYSRAIEMTFSLTTMSMTSIPMMTSSQLIHFTFISPSNGYFMSPVYHGVIDGWPFASYSTIQSSITITLPDDDHVVMLSAVEANHYRAQCICGPVYSCQMQKSSPEVASNTLEIRYGQTLFTYLVLSGTCPTKADVYHNNLMISFNGPQMISCVQFKYTFSFYPVSERPSKLANGLFNCSVPHYASFKQYLQCNMEPECHGGEDERDCPYNHKDCVGFFGDGTSCYKYTIWHKKLSWLQADEMCNNLGGRLPNLANQTKRDTFNRLFQTGSRWWWPVYVGATLQFNTSLPLWYKHAWTWQDNTISHATNMFYTPCLQYHVWEKPPDPLFVATPPVCLLYYPASPDTLSPVKCSDLFTFTFVCEFEVGNRFSQDQQTFSITVPTPTVKKIRSTRPTILCPEGHVTYDFLSCDPGSRCGVRQYLAECSTRTEGVMPKFVCSTSNVTIPYTFVCDAKPHCLDGSDEIFCTPDCPEAECDNSQCIPHNHTCDGVIHCADRSDENRCPTNNYKIRSSRQPPIPAVLDVVDSEYYNITPLVSSQNCPETHFQCPGGYCLPVFMLCNGLYDCPGHEDETGCKEYACPGFYRCWTSTVCVHLDHVCDGVYHCPKRDDEWMCADSSTQCPEGCQCQGLAFTCSRPFRAADHPYLRYLDASGSGMTPRDVTSNMKLVRLAMSSNNISRVLSLGLPDLLHLDMSDNMITSLSLREIHGLKKLRVLNLASNPLVSIVRSDVTMGSVVRLDVSATRLEHLSAVSLPAFPALKYLNVSHTPLQTLPDAAFNSTPDLSELDLSRVVVETLPNNIFYGVPRLRVVTGDSYLLCCRAKDFVGDVTCLVAEDPVSSCRDLLKSHLHVYWLWVVLCVAVLANGGCLLTRMKSRDEVDCARFHALLTNLQVSSLLMAVPLGVVLGTDLARLGHFSSFEWTWRKGAWCHVTGFLTLLSYQVSSFTLLLLTFDRVLAVVVPNIKMKVVRQISVSIINLFTEKKSDIVCFIAWGVGVTMAALPLLPVTSRWQFYSQTELCFPVLLESSTRNWSHYLYYVCVVIVLQLVILLAVLTGQILLRQSMTKDILISIPSHSSQGSALHQKLAARRLMSVAVFSIACWFLFSLTAMLTATGAAVPDQVNVGVAVFLLPLPSALSPVLYLLNVIKEKQRRASEKRVHQWLQSRQESTQLTRIKSSRTVPTTDVMSSRVAAL